MINARLAPSELSRIGRGPFTTSSWPRPSMQARRDVPVIRFAKVVAARFLPA